MKNLQNELGGGAPQPPPPVTARKKKALIAEPEHHWAKSPSTTHLEFKNRLGKGHDPHAVYGQLISEINDHLASGDINNRDAHRAASEAFGRLLMSRRQRPKQASFLGHTPDHKIPEYLEHLRGRLRDENISQGELSDLQGLAEAGYIHPDDMELHEAAGTSEEDFRRGQDRDPDNDPFDPREFGASRKQAWIGWGKEPKHHKAAGWEWDDYLSAHVASPGTRTFTCSCGEKFPVPNYHQCKCGKLHNAYVIGTGGDRREATMEKMLCREVVVRPDVIVARKAPKKKSSSYDDYDPYSSENVQALEKEIEDRHPFPSKHQPVKKKDLRSKGVTDGKSTKDWYSRDHGSQQFRPQG